MENIKKRLGLGCLLGCLLAFQSASAQVVTLDFKGSFRSFSALTVDSQGYQRSTTVGSVLGGNPKAGDPFEFKITYEGELTPQSYISYVYMFGFGQGTLNPVGDMVSTLDFKTAAFAFNSTQLGLNVGDEAEDIDFINENYDWLTFSTKAISLTPSVYLESFAFNLLSLDSDEVIRGKVRPITSLAPFTTGPSYTAPSISLIVDDLSIQSGPNRFQLNGYVTSLVVASVPSAVPEPSTYGVGAVISLFGLLTLRRYFRGSRAKSLRC